jgi:peptide/nickel transport system permease protein
LLELVPGDPAVAVLGQDATPEEYARVREDLGLNKPLVERYVSWVGGVVQGDLGTSLFPPKRDVADLIGQRLPVTIEVALLSMALSVLVALPVAMRTAYRSGDVVDRAATGLAFGAISIPVFLAGLLFVFFFVFNPTVVQVVLAVVGGLLVVGLARWGWRRGRWEPPGPARSRAVGVGLVWAGVAAVATVVVVVFFPDFPRQGFVRIEEGGLRENLLYVALPVFTLSLTECAVFIRLLRSDLIHTLGEDYILSARAKGMPPSHIMVRHALRPSCFSLITVISVTLGRIIGGAVVVEIIFNLPGMGRLIVDSIAIKDYPVVQACVLMIAVLYVVTSAFVDVLYAYLDPRIRRGRV